MRLAGGDLDGSTEPAWKVRERVVAKLERALTPDASVETNVRLKALDGSGYRQCDVVVRYGRPPRDTLTIVEVQDRGSQVDVNTFGGWCEKMRSVGAQHLICVSNHEYPESIRIKARNLGPSVRLLNLRDLDAPLGPNGSVWPSVNLRFYKKLHTDVDLHIVTIQLPPTVREGDLIEFAVPFNRKAAIFTPDGGGEARSIDDLVDAKLRSWDWDSLECGVVEIEVLSEKDGEFRHALSTPPATVTVKAVCRVEITEVTIPLSSACYTQHDVEGELGWVMSGSASAFGSDISYRAIVVRDENGDFQVLRPDIVGDGFELLELRITKNGKPFVDFRTGLVQSADEA